MNRIIAEELILLVSVVKWIILSAFVGLAVGLSTSVFLLVLDAGILIREYSRWHYFLLPAAFVFSSFIVRRLSPDAGGHGTEKIIEAVHRHSGRMKPSVIPVKLAATVITIASGGSAGKEGPCAQIGAGIASFFAGLFRFDDTDRKKFVICGISAGFASVFGTPIAGAVFGIEALFIGGMLYKVLLPSFISGIISYYVTSFMGVAYFNYPVIFSMEILSIFDGWTFIIVILSGIFFGFCSLFFIETMNFFKRLHSRIRLNVYLKAALGGVSLVLLTLVFSEDYLGLGLPAIKASLSGGHIVWYAFLLKILFTCVTLNFGGSGGVVTPIFFIGATSGVLFAGMLGLDPTLFAAIGFVSLLAGAANTPIAAAIMSVEVFGPDVFLYASTACVISFFITGHRSIFPSQVLNIQKSTSIAALAGMEVENLVVSVRKRKKSALGMVERLSGRMKAKRKSGLP